MVSRLTAADDRGMGQPLIDPARDGDDAAASSRDALGELLSASVAWLGNNLHFFPGNTKATIELALLNRLWARSRPVDRRLEEVSRLLSDVWRDPGFRERILALPHHAYVSELAYAGLAPAGARTTPGELPRTPPRHEHAVLPAEHLAFLRLEARYYTDLAGLALSAVPYRELYRPTVLGSRVSVSDISDDDAYLVTHIAFYLGDFGSRVPPLSPADVDHAAAVVAGLLERCVRRGHNWDLVSELVLAQYCLGADPLRTRGGRDAIAGLAAAQLADGSLPGRTPASKPGLPPPDGFRYRYHSTLAATLMAALVSARPAGHMTRGLNA
jgi:hypothetical protein